MRPGKANRVFEGPHQAAFCSRLAIPTLAEIVAPGTTEAGDILWLDSKTLLIGHGYRTNAAGIDADARPARAQREYRFCPRRCPTVPGRRRACT